MSKISDHLKRTKDGSQGFTFWNRNPVTALRRLKETDRLEIEEEIIFLRNRFTKKTFFVKLWQQLFSTQYFKQFLLLYFSFHLVIIVFKLFIEIRIWMKWINSCDLINQIENRKMKSIFLHLLPAFLLINLMWSVTRSDTNGDVVCRPLIMKKCFGSWLENKLP